MYLDCRWEPIPILARPVGLLDGRPEALFNTLSG